VTIQCMALLLLIGSAVASTPAGTIIENRARLSYIDGATGKLVNIVSNISTISVAQYFDFSILAKHTIRPQAGSLVNLSHQLVNTGNAPDDYFLAAKALTSSGGSENDASGETSLAAIVVYHDLNGNGVVDADEPEINHTPVLAAGQSIDLVVQGVVPRGVLPGTSMLLEMSAKSLNTTTLIKSVVDETIIATNTVLDITKHSSPECRVALFPGDEVTHRVEIRNTGSAGIDGTALMINGQKQTGVVIKQPVPAHMQFSGFKQRNYACSTSLIMKILPIIYRCGMVSI